MLFLISYLSYDSLVLSVFHQEQLNLSIKEIQINFQAIQSWISNRINKFNRLLHSMSIHSAKNPQNPIDGKSQHGSPPVSPESPSVLPEQPPITTEQHQWIAAYIDGQYFLTDPLSMGKLKNIEAEIQQERLKLAQLEIDNNQMGNSFLSLQEDKVEKQSNASFCNTQFNENKQNNKELKVKNQLEKQEEKYKEKIKLMEKERSQMKKEMTPINKEKAEALQSPNGKGSQRKSSHKEEVKAQITSPIQKSIRSVKKSVRQESKEKSYHKSRIQQTINDNLQLQRNQAQGKIQKHLVQAAPQQPEKSIRSHRTVNKSLALPEENNTEQPKQFIQNIDSKKDDKISVKIKKSIQNQPINQQFAPQIIQKAQTIKKSVKEPSNKKSEFPPSERSKGVGLDYQSKQPSKGPQNNIQKDYSQKQSRKIGKSKQQVGGIQKSIKSSRYEVKVMGVDGNINNIQPNAQKSNQLTHLNNEVIETKSKRSQIVKDPSYHNQETKSKKSQIQVEQNRSRKSHQLAKPNQQLSNARQEDNKSKKTTKEIEDIKSKKSHQFNQIQTKSRKSQVPIDEEIISKKSQIIKEQQIKSKKSSLPKQQDAKSKHSNIVEVLQGKNQKINVNSRIQDQKSHKSFLENDKEFQKEQIKSKLSSNKNNQKSSKQYQTKSIKKDQSKLEADESKSRKSQVVQQSVSRKSNSIRPQRQLQAIPVSNNSSRIPEPQTKVDKSIQWSRVTDPHKESHVNQIKFQNVSEKNSSFIQHNEESMNESSHLKLQILNNQLHQEQVQQLESHLEQVPNMKKKKESSQKDNQSQKKSRSFIIHSRNGSVKQRSEKNYEERSRSKYSESKRNKQSETPSEQSATKVEIIQLQEQIVFLRNKLQKVEERQQQMQKMEVTLSKIHKQQIEQIEPLEPLYPALPESPLMPQIPTSEISIGLRPQFKLQIESSIVQVNTKEDLKKKLEKESEGQEKNRLKEEISRLKKIIRDMQIQKIKSIDHENQMIESGLHKKDSQNLSQKESRIQHEKESLSGFQPLPTQKRFYSKLLRADEAGRIIKNSHIEPESPDISPRRRSQLIKYVNNDDEVVMEPQELPFQSTQKIPSRPSKLINAAKQRSLIDRISDKDQDFHHFIQTSRALVQEETRREPQQIINEAISAPFQQFSRIQVGTHTSQPSNKINYSRLVQQFRKNNPEDEEILPEIHLRDVKVPELPNTPSPELSQDDLLSLAKRTYSLFGVDIDKEDKQLCVKKYKNCVVFTITNNPSECILWHFSGKFYMGGWKAGQPGEGQKNGEGLEIVPDKHIYKGQFLNGKKNGTGILKLVNNNIYDGQWIDGLKNGRGAYLDAATRVIYTGQWKEGKKDGQGFLKLSEKEYYYGTFVKSIKEGFGAQVFVNGDKYKGQYKNGKFHGKGKYTWANGSCYEGQFVQGVRQGQGSWKSAKVNGDIYIGTYHNDKKNGYGRYVWANGCTYQGGFANDVKHGKGRLTYQDGKEVKGMWEDGNLINTEGEKQPADHEDQPLRRSVKISSIGGYRQPANHRLGP